MSNNFKRPSDLNIRKYVLKPEDVEIISDIDKCSNINVKI